MDMGRYCKKYAKMAEDHPVPTALAGLGLGLALAFCLGKWLSGSQHHSRTARTVAALRESGEALAARTAASGQKLLGRHPSRPSTTAVGTALGGAGLLVGGLLAALSRARN